MIKSHELFLLVLWLLCDCAWSGDMSDWHFQSRLIPTPPLERADLLSDRVGSGSEALGECKSGKLPILYRTSALLGPLPKNDCDSQTNEDRYMDSILKGINAPCQNTHSKRLPTLILKRYLQNCRCLSISKQKVLRL